jgi:hypothetical protein
VHSSGRAEPIFEGAADLDLGLLECRVLDVLYRPSLH